MLGLGFRMLMATLALTQTGSALAAQRPIDFVLDLDRMLVQEVTLHQARKAPSDMIIALPPRYYRMTDGAREFLQSLREIPGARISFFSRASSTRNHVLLKKFILHDGASAWNLAEGRVYSDSNLTRPNGIHELGKDLRIVAADVDLGRAFLIDDHFEYSLVGQERNLIYMPDWWASFEESLVPSLLELDVIGDLEESQREATTFVIHRNKLIRARGLIEMALLKAAAEGISPADASASLQYSPTRAGFHLMPGLLKNLEPYRIGLKFFKAVNPGFRFTGIFSKPSEWACGKGFADGFRPSEQH